MGKQDQTRSDSFFEHAAFDQLVQDARQRRAFYLKRNPVAILALVGSSVVLICGASLLASVTSRHTGPNFQLAGSGYESEARVSAATDQIETLKSTLESVSAVAPEVAREIKQQIGQAAYSCSQTPCSAPLQQRNYVARSQLIALLVKKTLPDQSRKAAAR